MNKNMKIPPRNKLQQFFTRQAVNMSNKKNDFKGSNGVGPLSTSDVVAYGCFVSDDNVTNSLTQSTEATVMISSSTTTSNKKHTSRNNRLVDCEMAIPHAEKPENYTECRGDDNGGPIAKHLKGNSVRTNNGNIKGSFSLRSISSSLFRSLNVKCVQNRWLLTVMIVTLGIAVAIAFMFLGIESNRRFDDQYFTQTGQGT